MALANQQQVETLADSFTKCADSLHERLMQAIKNREIDRYTAQIIFQDESVLRQRANSLYIDAANCVVDDLAESQESVLEVIDSARAKMRKIKEIADFIDLVADLLVLAAAAYAAKPMPIMAALQEVKEDVMALGREA